MLNSKLKTVLRVLSNGLIVAVLLAFLLHGFRLFGMHNYSVISGSMKKVYPTGSMIYVKKTDPASLQAGDVITFTMKSGTVATHRIIELVPDEDNPQIIRFRTKGDENKIADGELVDFHRVIGTPVFCIPLLGYLSVYIKIPPGKYVAITAAVVLVLAEILISIILDDKSESKNNASKAEAEQKA